MPALPLPIFIATILIYLLVRVMLRGEATPLIRLVIGFCAAQALIITAHLHYNIAAFALLQPVTAATIPPLIYLGFLSLARRPLQASLDAWHLLAPGFTLFCLIFVPQALDIVIPTLFAAYGISMLVILRGGADATELERLEEGGLPARIWRFVAAFLLLSALSDILIALDFLLGSGANRGWITTVFASATLLGLGLASLARANPPEQETPAAAEPTPSPHGSDEEIMARLDALLAERGMFRNPDLTLAQLARRLMLPAKALSAAINRRTGMNVSQYVNGYRIRAACEAMTTENCSVTEAMLSSGFQTKSNFNREFRRVTGTSPSGWIKRPQPPQDSPVNVEVIAGAGR